MTKEEVEKKFIDGLEKLLSVGLIEQNKVLSSYRCEVFDLLPVYGTLCVDATNDIGKPDSAMKVIRRGRYFFNRASNSEFLNHVFANQEHPFLHAPETPAPEIIGYSYDEIIDKLVTKLSFAKLEK